jgi:hypothetical protein
VRCGRRFAEEARVSALLELERERERDACARGPYLERDGERREALGEEPNHWVAEKALAGDFEGHSSAQDESK